MTYRKRCWNTLLGICTFVFMAIGNAAHAGEKPVRIVSVNLCTDQLLMMLVKPDRIAALSRFARQPERSVMAAAAMKLPFTYGNAEDVVRLAPDLILAGTYTTRATLHLLRKLGQNIVEIAPARGFADIVKNIRRIAQAVGEMQKGDQMISALQNSLSKMNNKIMRHKPSAALLYTNSYTFGPGTLAHEIVSAGGFANLSQQLGIFGTTKLSLETLLLQPPDALILGHTGPARNDRAREVFHHPALRHLLAQIPSMILADRSWLCGTPYTLKAVERIRNFRDTFTLLKSRETK